MLTGHGQSIRSQVENGVKVAALVTIAFVLGFQVGMAAMVAVAGTVIALPVGIPIERDED